LDVERFLPAHQRLQPIHHRVVKAIPRICDNQTNNEEVEDAEIAVSPPSNARNLPARQLKGDLWGLRRGGGGSRMGRHGAEISAVQGERVESLQRKKWRQGKKMLRD
jgi:hypothetical protein